MTNIDTLAAEFHDASFRLGMAIRDELKTRLIERGVPHVTGLDFFENGDGEYEWFIKSTLSDEASRAALDEAASFLEFRRSGLFGEFRTSHGLSRSDLAAAFDSVSGVHDEFYVAR